MEGSVEPGLILKNGDPNPAWIVWYMKTSGCNDNKARYDWWQKLRQLEEPSLTTTKGNPNPIWVAWWRGKKNCSRNVALNTCKAKINGTYIPNKKMEEFLGTKKVKRLLGEL